ncbi:MAG: hypothetical protein QW778_02880 [Candidatus Micrarchaeaceae archaeon]
MVTVTPITITTSSDLLGGNSKAMPIAVGENQIILYTESNYLVKIDISKKTVAYSASLKNAFTNTYIGPIYNPNIDKNGYIRAILFYMKTTESSGSRYLYAREITIDPSTLNVQLGTERQYSNNVINNTIPVWTSFLKLSENLLLAAHDNIEKNVVIDLYKKRIFLTPSLGNSGYFNTPLAFLVDQTTNNTAIFLGQHYWMTGSYGTVVLVNPRDFTQIASINSFDPGSGMFGWKKYYIDSQGAVRLIAYGASSGYNSSFALSRWHAFYLDNGSLNAEFIVSPGSSYLTSDPANRHPHILGVRTSDNRIMLATYGHPWTNCSTWGVGVVDTDDKLQNPANLVEAKVPVSTSEQAGYIGNPSIAFLDENTYDILIYGGVITYNGQPTLFLFDIGQLPDMHYDPFNIVPVPKSGLIPTTLTLNVTPL